MKSFTFVITFAIVALHAHARNIVPYDLADQAQDQLDKLKDTVRGNILVAHDDLSDELTSFQTKANTEQEQGSIDIQSEHQTISAQLETLRNLAASAGVDASTCLDVREQVVDRLPSQHTDNLVSCITEYTTQAAQIIRDATYTVDVVINKVNSLQFELNSCRGEMSCITPILTTIQLNEVRLPQNIQTEVNAAQNLLNVLFLSVNQCSSTHVTAYVSAASSIVSDAEACVNRILP